MAEQLPIEQLKLGHSVSEIHSQEIKTTDGKSWQGRAVVLATDFEITNQFLGVEGSEVEWNAVDCLYFSLPEKDLPLKMPILHLDGSGDGPINNLTFVSNLCECVPDGKALASASVIGREDLALDELVESESKHLVFCFGESCKSWNIILIYRI